MLYPVIRKQSNSSQAIKLQPEFVCNMGMTFNEKLSYINQLRFILAMAEAYNNLGKTLENLMRMRKLLYKRYNILEVLTLKIIVKLKIS